MATANTAPAGTAWAWPVQARVTQEYGVRNGHENSHPGMDLAAPTGTPIHAAAAGTVTLAGPNAGYGNCVILDHGDGITTLYGHMSAIKTAVGNRVGLGDVIGLVGSTGYSTGPHLHLEVRRNGQTTNPRLTIPGDPATSKPAEGGIGGIVTTAASDPAGAVKLAGGGTADLFAKLADARTWARVLSEMVGLVLLVSGLLMLSRDLWVPVAKKTAVTAAKAAVVA